MPKLSKKKLVKNLSDALLEVNSYSYGGGRMTEYELYRQVDMAWEEANAILSVAVNCGLLDEATRKFVSHVLHTVCSPILDMLEEEEE